MTVLVTGAGGFLGSAVTRMLLDRGVRVRALSRNNYSQLTAWGVTQICGDIADEAVVQQAAEGCDAVFHIAAKAGVWGRFESYWRANVKGTVNVLSACRTHKIAKLIYTSSPSVTFAGTGQEGVNESEPYPSRFLAAYPQTKAEAEKRVLAANRPDLATVALRPHLIWGPGDNHLVPRIVDRARAGTLKLVAGGRALVDSTFIGNAATAHLNAWERLRPDAPLAGRAYFISNGEPMPMVQLINGILNAAGLPPVTKSVPAGLAYGAGAVLETLYRMTKRQKEPMMTRFVARQLATAHYFDLSAAKSDLGYQPEVSISRGLELLKASLASS